MISQQKKSGKIELNSGSPSNRPLCAWLQSPLSLKFHGYITMIMHSQFTGQNYFLSWQSTSKASLRHFLNVPSSNINVSNSIMKLHLSEAGLEIQWPITGKRWWAFLEALLWDLGSSPLPSLWIASRGIPEEEEGWTILLLAPQAQPLSFSSSILILIVKKIWQACPRDSFRHPAQPMNLLI